MAWRLACSDGAWVWVVCSRSLRPSGTCQPSEVDHGFRDAASGVAPPRGYRPASRWDAKAGMQQRRGERRKGDGTRGGECLVGGTSALGCGWSLARAGWRGVPQPFRRTGRVVARGWGAPRAVGTGRTLPSPVFETEVKADESCVEWRVERTKERCGGA